MLALIAGTLTFGLGKTDFNICQFGAVGDGMTLSTTAIQKAIDAAADSGTGVVLFPPGKYLSGTLQLRSHLELKLASGATLLGSPYHKDYKRGKWYGLLLAENVQGLKITGKGMIDGQGAELAQDVLNQVKLGKIKIPKGDWRPNEVDRPVIIEFRNCLGVQVEGVSIKHSCCWVQNYVNCTDLTINGITVDSKTYWNNDGIDITDCKRVRVSNCDIDSADDGICLKSDSPSSACDDVSIENCRIRSSASAIKFGTASHGGFHRVSVRNIQIRDTYRSCVALESVDGGTLSDVSVDGVKAVNTGNAFVIRLGDRNRKRDVGSVQRISLRNFDVQIPAGAPDQGYPFQGPPVREPHNLYPSSIIGIPGFPVRNVSLEGIRIRTAGGGTSVVAHADFDQVPEREASYPEFSMLGELPAWALFIRHADGVSVKNCSFSVDKPDYRVPFAADDVTHLSFQGTSAGRSTSLRARNCRELWTDSKIKIVP